MKIAEETLKEVLECHKIYQTFLTCHPEWLMKKTIEAIKQAQKEAIEETVKLCVDTSTNDSYDFYQVELELKKELNL